MYGKTGVIKYKKVNNYPKKKWGQNFLTDKNIAKKIINLVPKNTKEIIEIGPGKGALTNLLIKK